MANFTQSTSLEPNLRLSIENENWKGKNDPTERRRIQNRLNQRAFRQRQRSGDHQLKLYKPRNDSGEAFSAQDEEEDQTSPFDEEPPHQGRAFDELAQLINGNFMVAAATNARHLGIDIATLQRATPILTPRGMRSVPATLLPVQLQHQIPHDVMIDIIPHARLRHNILRAIASQQLNAAEFSGCLRASGALESTWQRGGLVVWSSPEQPTSYELSGTFLRRFPFLLEGCGDLIASTNHWRGRRGEQPFSPEIGR